MEKINFAMNSHRLAIFAFHVSQICNSKIGDKFCLYFNSYCRAEIEIVSEGEVRVNGEWVGNRQGAVSKYVDMVSETESVL